ncbi:hypothetical protein NECAME_06981 [Necator americanus]|uniref:Uncharacterized protein n=1 Tax=Necator americanus TaxID=51031 RepID=W2TT41_NECAM|nr:hypothetical protein NECAME_06981 [Necator americanus]ETN84237.1 hypothetical protein NECAME_06981 [Necator americanus]
MLLQRLRKSLVFNQTDNYLRILKQKSLSSTSAQDEEVYERYKALGELNFPSKETNFLPTEIKKNENPPKEQRRPLWLTASATSFEVYGSLALTLPAGSFPNRAVNLSVTELNRLKAIDVAF